MGRFDYTPEACFQFHDAVKKEVMPLVDEIYSHHKKRLGLETLRPWDTEAEPSGTAPLRPFTDGNDLLNKSIECLDRLDPFFGDCLRKMKELNHLDLDSRKGKAPGGYNMPLAESGAPFIFMNAASQMSDLTTMVHEAGHAVHSFLAHPLELTAFKEYPTEMAEVASMSMELFTMDHWDMFFESEEDMKRAKRHQLERVITIFPWIATIDAFQHWIYEHPNHTMEERKDNWLRILNTYSTSAIDYTGLEPYRSYSWQRQLHLFEVPFYYIEYGIAQLGAIGMWKQYREDPKNALNRYINGLSLGGTKRLPELYQSSGIQFDFSHENIRSLMLFVKNELDSL
jgi:oligoendopeptidase F